MATTAPMLDEIRRRLPEIEELCRRHHVTYLAVFGSAVTDEFDPARSDLDFLVEYDDADSGFNAWDDYWRLKHALAALFGREVDLVDRSVQKNPYFIRSYETTQQPLYAA